jgi:predicted ATPase/class 3 adenylate cyclase
MVERKLATVMFVDLVDSTALVTASDPEVVRRRVNRYFEQVSHCIEALGGTVEKFAGDAVMAAFGVPLSHEDDAERALRAALQILSTVEELGLEVRIGIESGEVVVEEIESTFATGDAVNIAARLQQNAPAGAVLIGQGVLRLAGAVVDAEEFAAIDVRGREEPLRSWRLLAVRGWSGRPLAAAPLVGREAELELLQNTYARAVRDRRAQLVTVFGEPGIGKSRLVHEFIESVERATILRGRSLPFGEGITYWPLAEMVKESAGITDDDPVAEAFEKLRASCESEAIADLLASAAGLLGASDREQSREELLWAARAWAEQLAEAQPLILVFEDIHWAEEPLLDVIEQLAQSLRVPLLIVSIARPELLEARPTWGGGSLRAAAIELAPLNADESMELAEALTREGELTPSRRALVLEKAEGNPLFLEETIRMLAEHDGEDEQIPDSIQALIAARIDRLPVNEKRLLQHASVVGRVFWPGPLEQQRPDADVHALLDTLVAREFVTREERSTISGEEAFRFKHVLIRDVAYSALSMSERAELHASFAGWLAERAGDEVLEIRAYHLDQAVCLHVSLDGSAPDDLRVAAAAALEGAGRRAMQREAFQTARKQLLRALELEPTLRRRYLAAHAAWRLVDISAVTAEMEQVATEAAEAGESRIQARALTALAETALYRNADVEEARALIARAAEVLGGDEDVDARFDIYSVARTIASWVGDIEEAQRTSRDALELARSTGRKDLQAIMIHTLAQDAIIRLDIDEAESLAEQAQELTEESGSVRARAAALGTQAWLDEIRDRPEAAERSYRELFQLYTDIGHAAGAGAAQLYLGRLLHDSGQTSRAETALREALRILSRIGDRGRLCEAQRLLAQTLVTQGKLDEAERVALQSLKTVGPEDRLSVWTTQMALGVVRAAQGRDQEAEPLLRDAVAAFVESGHRFAELQALEELARFLRARGRDDEAALYEERAFALAPVPASTERIA